MKKIGVLVLAIVLCLSANGVIFADGVLISDRSGDGCGSGEAARDGVLISDFTGVLISDFVDAASAASATGILIVGKSGVLVSDFAGGSGCSE